MDRKKSKIKSGIDDIKDSKTYQGYSKFRKIRAWIFFPALIIVVLITIGSSVFGYDDQWLTDLTTALS